MPVCCSSTGGLEPPRRHLGCAGRGAKQDEPAEDAAIREADEEAGVPPHLVRVLGTSVFDIGYWSYTTVLARSTEFFEPYVGDAESIAMSWVPFADVAGLPLHPGLASGWPALRSRLASSTPSSRETAPPCADRSRTVGLGLQQRQMATGQRNGGR